MRFLWPDLLWLLLLLPVLVAAYLHALRRRKREALHYASLSLVRGAIGPGQRIRRHLPALLLLLSLAAALVAIARPTATVVLPSQYLTVVLAMDVSRSMLATDVEPTRITAAQDAARGFIESLPRNVRLGVIAFAGTAAVVQAPTDRKDDLVAAIDRLQLQFGTATGTGLILSLAELLPDAGITMESVPMSSPFLRRGGQSAPIDRPKSGAQAPDFVPVPPGSYTNGAIILLSDGRRTTGPDPIDVARLAADRGVRVYTVGFGSREGGIVDMEGRSYYMRLDEDTLRSVARMTKAEYFHAGTAQDLRVVYDKLSSRFALERKDTEIGAILCAVAALLAALGAGLSLLWFHRGR